MTTTTDYPAGLRQRDILDSLWRLCSSPYLTLALATAVALSLLVASLLPQQPPAALSDSAVRGQWLALVHHLYPTTGETLLALGALDVFHSLWFRLLVALLAFNLCLSLINLAESLWQSRRSIAVRRPESFFAEGLSTVSLTTAWGWEEVLESVRRTLTAVLTRPREEFAQGTAYFYADTGLWSHGGALALHLGALLLLLGGLIGGRWGWQTEPQRLGPGRQADIRETDYTLRLDDLAVSEGHFRAEVALLREGEVVSRGVVGERKPLRHSGLTVRGIGYGPAAVVRAWDEVGRSLTLQSFAEGAEPAEVAYLPFGALGEEHYCAVPESNLVVRLVLVEDESADVGPSFEMQAYRSNSADPVFEGTLSAGDQIAINGHRYSVEVQYYALLLVRHDPGSGLVLLGLLLAASGMMVTLWKPRAQAWVLVADEGGEVIIRVRGETHAHDRRFARLMTELTEHLTEPGLVDGGHG